MVSTADTWRDWIGREEKSGDVLDPARAQALHTTFERPGNPPAAGDPLPPLWHWIYYWGMAPMAALAPDGHVARGSFLPPIELPRRMWAGSRFTFHRPLRLGSPTERCSKIAEVSLKQGRSSALVFVTVHHAFSDCDGICFEEEQDLVFREAHRAGEAMSSTEEQAPKAPVWQRQMALDPVFLFRYSALTFNGHRIHYDRHYATEVEGYPGLVVHGPLLGTFMLQLALDERPGRRPATYRFRLRNPVFEAEAFVIAGAPLGDDGGARLWVTRADGAIAAEGLLEFA
jgi:3-methylfumaryl-CoA hydratase